MSIYKKLFEAKKEIGKISKDSTNPFYKSKYFDINQLLEHVEPILQKHNLLVLQPILTNSVVTQIIDSENGEMVTSGIELTNQTDPQKRGSEITYYRRYTLGSLLGLQAEDDDANATVKKHEKTSSKKDDNKEWLNQFVDREQTEQTTEWKRAVATLKAGKDINYLRTKFKISNSNADMLEMQSKSE
jgi:hypothetical protein